MDNDRTTRNRREYVRTLLALITQPRVAALLAVRALPVFLYITYLTYVSLLVVRTMDGSAEQAGLIVAITAGTYALVATQAGRVKDSFDERVSTLLATQLLMALGVVTFALASSILLAIPGAIALGAGFGLGMSLVRSIVTNFASDDLRGGLVSLFEAVGRISATLAPIMVGGLLSISGETVLGYSTLQVIIVGIGAIGGIVSVICLLFARASAEVTPSPQPQRRDSAELSGQR